MPPPSSILSNLPTLHYGAKNIFFRNKLMEIYETVFEFLVLDYFYTSKLVI